MNICLHDLSEILSEIVRLADVSQLADLVVRISMLKKSFQKNSKKTPNK